MKVLITGVAGFIGYHLVKRLIQIDKNVIIGLDNINDYYDQNLKYERLANTGIEKAEIKELNFTQSKSYPDYKFIKLDLTDKNNLHKLFHDFRPDVVINLAAQAGVRYSIENPDSYIQSNIVGFLNILEGCRYYPVKHLIYASSSSVYGNSNKVPFSEEDRTDTPLSLYAATKKSNELMAYAYSHLYKIPTTGLRFFTVYGPYGRPDMAPMIFTDAIINRKLIKIFNNGNLKRDFTYIDDIIEGLILIINNIPSKVTDVPYYKIYNIGKSEPIEILDFINIIEGAINKKASIEMYPMQKGDVKITHADIEAINKDFNYIPFTTLKEGIIKFLKWYIRNKIE